MTPSPFTMYGLLGSSQAVSLSDDMAVKLRDDINKKLGVQSILQDWVQRLGLRHQGVLVSAVRGCDDEPRNSCTKILIRCLRETMLVCHCGDSAKAATFIEKVDPVELLRRMDEVRKNLDHLPHHFVMHLIHAAEIIGYKHPDDRVSQPWMAYYAKLVHCLHLNPETEEQLDRRLNADEESFARAAMDSNGCPVGTEVKLRAGGDWHDNVAKAEAEEKTNDAGTKADENSMSYRSFNEAPAKNPYPVTPRPTWQSE